MKKLLSTLIVLSILCLCLPVLPVSAATTESSRPNASERAERIALRIELLDLRIEILENRKLNLQLSDENHQLRQSLKEKLAAAKDSLGEETISQLKDLHAQVKALLQELQETRGSIREISKDIRQLIAKHDLPALKAAYESIIRIQLLRHEKLAAINLLLQQMLDLLD